MKYKFPFIMKSIAGFTSAVTVGLVLAYRCWDAGWMLAAAISFGTTAYHFVMRLAVGYVVPRVTGYDFDYRHPWFRPRYWEAGLYKTLRLHRWKGFLPTYSPEQFDLRKHSLHRIIQNMCGAEVVHETIMVLSFLPLALVPVFGEFGVFFVTSVCAAAVDGVFVMAQRYNRPRVVRLYERKEWSVP